MLKRVFAGDFLRDGDKVLKATGNFGIGVFGNCGQSSGLNCFGVS